jgi:hypothetical protein
MYIGLSSILLRSFGIPFNAKTNEITINNETITLAKYDFVKYFNNKIEYILYFRVIPENQQKNNKMQLVNSSMNKHFRGLYFDIVSNVNEQQGGSFFVKKGRKKDNIYTDNQNRVYVKNNGKLKYIS